MTETWDVIVIGGGPAGSAAAITARKHGCRALVLEAEVFPRHHVGESLVYLWQTFESLGVAETMDATFQHKLGGTRIWGEDARPRYADFSHLTGARKHSLQVERSLFDHILLRRAEELGAEVRQAARVGAVLWEGDRAVGVTYTRPEGQTAEARAPFVVDAGGRRSLIARARRLQTVDPFYPDLAVYGYFTDAARLEGKHAGDVVIEAMSLGWLWFIPLHTGEVSVGLVSDRSSRPAVRRMGLEPFFRDALARSDLVGGLVRDARLVKGPIAAASFGYTSRQYAGPGWFLAGDAAFFTDPMWATGVGNALSNGVLAGASVEAVLSGRVSEERAMRYYNRELSGIVSSIDATIKFVYGCNRVHADSPFWARRHRYLEKSPPPMERVSTVFGPSISRTLAQIAGLSTPVMECP